MGYPSTFYRSFHQSRSNPCAGSSAGKKRTALNLGGRLSLRATTSEGVVDSPSWLDWPLEEVRAACDNSDKVPSCRPNVRHEHVEASGSFAPVVCRAPDRKKIK